MTSKKCIGCGVSLQEDNTTFDGYTSSLNNDICNRCFKMKNYGEYYDVNRSNDDYEAILESINETKDLVIYVVDLLNLTADLNSIRKHLQNRMIVVLAKRDVLPKSVNELKLLKKMKEAMPDAKETLIISSEKNYNLDNLMTMIKKHQSSKNVYVVGMTNAGKSSLINKLIKNYSDEEGSLTISPIPSTTVDKIEIDLNENLRIIDTPGLVEDGNISNYLDPKTLKRLAPKKEIKPRVYQMRQGQALIIEDFLRIDIVDGEKSSFICYFSNDVKVKKHSFRNNKLKDLAQRSLDVSYYQDIVIPGLGFIKVVGQVKVEIYANINIKIFLRSSLI